MRIVFSKKKLKYPKIKLFILEIILFLLMTISYNTIIIGSWSYMGFKNNTNLFYFFIGFFIVFIILFFGSFLKKGLSHTIWHILIILCLFPQTIYFFTSSGNIDPVLAYLIFFMIFLFVDRLKIKPLKIIQINIEDENNFYIILFLTIILMVPFLYYLPYIDVSNLWLNNVYKTRSFFRTLPQIQGLGYLFAPLGRIVIPILLIVAYEKKKWFSFLLLISMLLYLYLASGALKSIFFGLIMAVTFYFGKGYRAKLNLFIVGFFLIIILGFIEYFLFHSSMFSNLPIRRVLFIPPYLENFYYQYFSHANKTFYAHTFFKNIINNPYNGSLSRYFGDNVIHKIGLNANVGIIPDGYISFGWFGVILHSFLFSFIVSFIKSLNIESKFFGIIMVYLYYFNTAFLGPYLLTHGFIFLIIFLLLCLRNN